MEMSRAALLSAFRGTDISGILFRRCVALAVRKGRRYMVLGSDTKRVPYYRHFGFLPTPITFRYPGTAKAVSQVLVADLQAIWRGCQGGPLLWHTLFADLDEDLPRGPFSPANWLDVARIGAMRRSEPLCQRVLQWYRSRRARALDTAHMLPLA